LHGQINRIIQNAIIILSGALSGNFLVVVMLGGAGVLSRWHPIPARISCLSMPEKQFISGIIANSNFFHYALQFYSCEVCVEQDKRRQDIE